VQRLQGGGKLLSPQEYTQSRTKQIEELTRRLDELSMRVKEIEEKISMDKVLKGWLIWLPELRSLRNY
jgi:hypothetical protein